MEEWMFWILYLVVTLFGIFIVVPFLKQRTSWDDEGIMVFGLVGSVVWPLAILVIMGYLTLWLPGVWLFEKSEEMFTPKPPAPPPPPPEIDPVKSTYRHVEFVKDDEVYTPHHEV